MTADIYTIDVAPEGFEFSEGQSSEQVVGNNVSDGYLETLGIPIIAGRGFNVFDTARSPKVAVVNEDFAKRYFKGNAVSKRFRASGKDEWVEVVGVAVNGKYATVLEPDTPFLYLAVSQYPQNRLTLVAETYGDPAAFAGALRELARATDPGVPVFAVRTMEDLFNQRSVQISHLLIGIVAAQGVLGLILALVGLYAVVAYRVTRSTRDIAIRMALGAARMQVLQLVLKQAGAMAITGIAIAVVMAFAGSSFFTAHMIGPHEIPMDWLRFAAVCGALLVTTLLAAFIPAHRATRIAPTEALRQE